MTTNELRDTLFKSVTATTAILIENGSFTYNGVSFSTCAKNRGNFSSLAVMNLYGLVTFPTEVFDGDNTISLASAEELVTFLGGFCAVVAELELIGKTIRDTLATMTQEELESFRDSRVTYPETDLDV